MAKQYDALPGSDKLGVTKSTVGAPGGGVGVRLIIDDAVVLGKADSLRLCEIIQQRVVEDTWPPA